MLPRNLDRYIMRNLLHLQLENERAIYADRFKEGRNDAVAKIVLARISSEINMLDRLLNEEQETRQESIKPRRASRFVQYVREALYRFRHYKDRRNHSISQVSASSILSTQAGA